MVFGKQFSVSKSKEFKDGQKYAKENPNINQDELKSEAEGRYKDDTQKSTDFIFGYNSIDRKAPNIGSGHSKIDKSRDVKQNSVRNKLVLVTKEFSAPDCRCCKCVTSPEGVSYTIGDIIHTKNGGKLFISKLFQSHDGKQFIESSSGIKLMITPELIDTKEYAGFGGMSSVLPAMGTVGHGLHIDQADNPLDPLEDAAYTGGDNPIVIGLNPIKQFSMNIQDNLGYVMYKNPEADSEENGLVCIAILSNKEEADNYIKNYHGPLDASFMDSYIGSDLSTITDGTVSMQFSRGDGERKFKQSVKALSDEDNVTQFSKNNRRVVRFLKKK